MAKHTIGFTDVEMHSNLYMKAPTPDNMYCVPPSLADLAREVLPHGMIFMVNTETGVIWVRHDSYDLWYDLTVWCECGCRKAQSCIVVRKGSYAGSRNGLITTKHLAEVHNNTKTTKLLFF